MPRARNFDSPGDARQRTDVGVAFRQSTKNPYNFVGSMTSGLRNAKSLEIVVSVTQNNTIGFRIYPHYSGGYINLGKARDTSGLMRKLLYYSDQNFLFWGADDTADVFCGYTITLESELPGGRDRRRPAQHPQHRQVRRRDAAVLRRQHRGLTPA